MFFLRKSPVICVAVVLATFQIAFAAGPSFAISRAGPSLTATLSNGGTASLGFNYDPGHNDVCGDEKDVPCFNFHAGDGAASIPMSAPGCKTIDSGAVDCPASGVSSVTIVLKNGGSVLTTCESGSCSGADCYGNVTIKAQAGKDGVYSIKTVDGCAQTIHCAAGMGTVEADPVDKVTGCAFVQRRSP